jgi:ABC-type transporter Mla MlaB component
MALLGNYSVILKNPATFIGGTQVSNCRSAFGSEGQMLQMYYGESEGGGLPLTASLDTGTEPPYSWHLAEKGGELSSTTMTNGTSTLTGSAAQGINVDSTIAGVGTIDTAGLSLVTSMIALIEGLGELTGSMVGTIQMAADLAGSGDITGALGMLSGMFANLSGEGSLSADLKGKLSMASTIYVNQSEATVQQIAGAILNALASDYNLSGTIGEAINGAGAAGNPWITDLSGYTTSDTAGKILREIYLLQGLDTESTVEITDTTRQVIVDSVAVIDQTIDDDGTTTTVERA